MSKVMALSLLLAACGTQKATQKLSEDDAIVFGTGGGFSGATDSYFLYVNGRIFHQNSLIGETKAQGRIGRKKAKKIFALYDELKLESISYDRPGNLYVFVEMRTPEGKRKYVWSQGDQGAPAGLVTFYQTLTTLIKPSAK